MFNNATNTTESTELSMEQQLGALVGNSDEFFLLMMGCFVFLMQAGFAFLEAGSVRSKNTTNILLKNILDVCIGAISYWAVGYAFAFGTPSNLFIGHGHFFLEGIEGSQYAHWFFHFVFAATASTIVSGAMAERTEFSAYLVYCAVLTGVVYPVAAHWAWDPQGWLLTGVGTGLTYQDFAGSGVVHIVGGTAALAGATVVGPRIGRFQYGKPVQISGHTVPLAALGAFILFFGFLAFNGGSQGSISSPGDGVIVALAITNTVISGSSAGLIAMVIKRVGLLGDLHWSLLTTLNGALTGMVAICAGCNNVYPWAACIIGVVAGVAYCGWSQLILKVLKVDDPLDAVAVHFGGGFWGVIAVPIFATEGGIITSGGSIVAFKGLGWNILGGVVIAVWTAIITTTMFGFLRLAGVLRVDPEIEEKGLDIPKHGEPAYPQESYGHGWLLETAEDKLPKCRAQKSIIESPPDYNGDTSNILAMTHPGSMVIPRPSVVTGPPMAELAFDNEGYQEPRDTRL
ncbi:putative ammonium transporter 1 [Branchiostoma floridae x Branchiostoma belcheri]